MRSERGHAALWVIGALAVSAAVGIGVYVVIKEQRAADAANERQTIIDTEPDPTPPVAATPLPPAPAEAPSAPAAAAPPVDRAEAEAIDPELGGESPATTAPLFGTPGVDGTLEPAEIAVAVHAGAPRLQRCFEKRLAAGATSGGIVRVTLIVNRRGGVTTATAVGVDDELATCTAAALKDIRFPRTTDGNTARIVYPIAFRTAGESDAGDPGATPCDEVSCVLDNYEGACCAKFRRPSSRPPDAAGVPDAPSREDLLTALKALRRKVAACASTSEFSGNLKVKFSVLPSGKVGTVTIEDVAPALAGCIARTFKAYTFPASVNGVTASFPFTISAE